MVPFRFNFSSTFYYFFNINEVHECFNERAPNLFAESTPNRYFDDSLHNLSLLELGHAKVCHAQILRKCLWLQTVSKNNHAFNIGEMLEPLSYQDSNEERRLSQSTLARL